jgi:hypothetical protein
MYILLTLIKLRHHTLTGLVRVLNIAYEKHVFIHMTTNEWKTVNNIKCVYLKSKGCFDYFTFNILLLDKYFNIYLLPNILTIRFVVGYQVNGNTFWDNNQNENYFVEVFATLAKNVKLWRSSVGYLLSNFDYFSLDLGKRQISI